MSDAGTRSDQVPAFTLAPALLVGLLMGVAIGYFIGLTRR